MANMLRVVARWTGFQGSPGYSNFFFAADNDGFHTDEAADLCADKVDAFFGVAAGLFPSTFRISTLSDVDEIDPTTGELQRTFNAGARGAVAGSAAANGYSGTSGAVVTWRTSGVRNGRRVRGRTFLVPTANVAYDIDGTLQNSTLTTLNNAATGLRTVFSNFQLGIWARPTAPGAADGAWFPVTSASVPDMPAVLRSRRD